ncbi:hypothetical protein A1F94_006570 [Pyrenophora tritici-repentis]|uniref:Uncharacterized protein n=1 Tax=Pyrenophora tritici-repentis TaxID=45151 RepID=A0A5M9KLK3_9PLEO|nr:hypothetical protein PtrV1_13715 [Pyrenophora tritici-repentis]KAF7447254.1 hypothetical protein A1F99_087010 [Pyrenophora tritici-repentis]KAF7569614.1 hypothetical protein PtrM4_120290 [Pyrenophora tritici-repentis]KAG9382649.1 hypothetical protein A1F94_006570 [Pyrenophora tritici-repentis]
MIPTSNTAHISNRVIKTNNKAMARLNTANLVLQADPLTATVVLALP